MPCIVNCILYTVYDSKYLIPAALQVQFTLRFGLGWAQFCGLRIVDLVFIEVSN